ncbi:MAG TPA: Flp family type IVb pilin [Hellea balneolensis]|uniref:Flp family type IVb pilin n=1 Tax=Hellea balneolensis TaxID=287478 RepID=A0A7C5R094_9PROT|nr:Flp family type IVb pilin [Hellea balneolensis]
MKTVSTFTRRFLADDSGATALEYALLIGILSLGVIVGVTGMGRRTTDVWNIVVNEVENS